MTDSARKQKAITLPLKEEGGMYQWTKDVNRFLKNGRKMRHSLGGKNLRLEYTVSAVEKFQAHNQHLQDRRSANRNWKQGFMKIVYTRKYTHCFIAPFKMLAPRIYSWKSLLRKYWRKVEASGIWMLDPLHCDIEKSLTVGIPTSSPSLHPPSRSLSHWENRCLRDMNLPGFKDLAAN